MKQPTYITTTIPYVNASPHLGFALELVQTDALARLYRGSGHAVRLQTGTDEHAFKNVEAARAAGVDPQHWVDAHAAEFRKLGDSLGISCDRFLRTTEPAHRRGVVRFWEALRPGDLRQQSYTGLYCSGCEDFVSTKDLVDGKCPEHGRAPTEVSETNYFFRLSGYQDAIDRWLASDQVVIRPEWRRQEILNFVRSGLQDISVSRPSSRAGGWGIPVPGDESQTIYVWIDALINYLTGLGYGEDESWRQWWNPGVRKIHLIGKNVWKFHAIYWPALLLSAGLPLPDEIWIHGFLTVDGRKIGKSLGNASPPGAYVEKYGADAVRYFLLRAVPPFGDSDFSEERLAAVYESDLANGLGNLLSRLLSLAERSGLDRLSECSADAGPGLGATAPVSSNSDQLDRIWGRIDELNRAIDEAKPWILLREGGIEQARTALNTWLVQLRFVGTALAPYLPESSERIWKTLASVPLRSIGSLFPRIADTGLPGANALSDEH